MTNLVRFLVVSALFILMAGCNGAVWGNLAVLGVSVGIFMGTLFLRKPSSLRDEGE
jgi:hypothetical protein